MHKTFREFNGKTYLLDEFSYFGISKSDAVKRKAMWKKSGLGARLITKANGKYVVIGHRLRNFLACRSRFQRKNQAEIMSTETEIDIYSDFTSMNNLTNFSEIDVIHHDSSLNR